MSDGEEGEGVEEEKKSRRVMHVLSWPMESVGTLMGVSEGNSLKEKLL